MKRNGLVFWILMAFSASAYADTVWISGKTRFGCATKEYFRKLVGFAVNDDTEAFKRSLAAGILAGQCIIFQNGEPVFLADTSILAGLVKVRRKGDVEEYWTNLEAVKTK